MYKELDAMNTTSTNDANDQRSQGRKPLAALVMSLYTLFLSKRWWWWGALLTWSLMRPCVGLFFFEFFGGSFKIWRCFLVCAIEKNGATWRTRHLQKKQQKGLLANSQAMWLVKWFDSSFLFFKPTFIRDKHTRKSIKGLILSKLLTIHRFDL